MTTMMNWFAVGFGAAMGAWVRWVLGVVLNGVFIAFPLGTLIANLVGGYLMGLAVGSFGQGLLDNQTLRLMITTGFLGGMTTFSAFSAEAAKLLQDSQYNLAIIHITAHVAGSLIMTLLGIWTIYIFAK